MIRLLLKRGANSIAKSNSGRTALHEASMRGNVSIVRQLLNNNKVDFKAIDENGCTAVHLAALEGHDSVVMILQESEANFELNEKEKESPADSPERADQ